MMAPVILAGFTLCAGALVASGQSTWAAQGYMLGGAFAAVLACWAVPKVTGWPL